MVYTELNGILRHHESTPKELDVSDSQRNGLTPTQPAERKREDQSLVLAGLHRQSVHVVR